MPKLTFVVGKGGVGKTTVACSLALHLARSRPRDSVLLMSTDPAHSLGDVLQVPLRHTAKRLHQARGKLFAWQIDSSSEFKSFLAGNREDILDIVETGTFFSREEIAPLLDTSLPGMAEVAALLAIQKLLEEQHYDRIVVDTAPFGHTLRLFELPAHFQKFLNFLQVASSRDALLAQRFGGRLQERAHPFVERWQRGVDQLKDAFSAKSADMILVTTPENFSLNEAVRCLKSLQESVPKIQLASIVLNRAIQEPGKCSHCRLRAKATTRAQEFLKKKLPGKPILIGRDPGNPILGLDLLARLGETVFAGRKKRLEHEPPARRGTIQLVRLEWPRVTVPLSFTVGKGGVGKTTVTAALGFRTRAADPSVAVNVCSTDPAPSLDDIFRQDIGDEPAPVFNDERFSAMEAESVSYYQRWASQMRDRLEQQLSSDSGGLHVDLTFEKEVFAALMDVVPPGVDELFAIFRILKLVESGKGKTFIDMAPTGHALELLRMPERILLWSRLLLKSLAAHRRLAIAQDVAVELAELGQRLRSLVQIMQDPKRSRIWMVMLAEPVPDHQTRRLVAAIKELGITPDSLFINRVLMEEMPACRRCSRARKWQLATLTQLHHKYRGKTLYALREFPAEIAGAAALKSFTSELWLIQ